MTDEQWYDGIAPEGEENTAVRESLGKFETTEAFFEAFNKGQAGLDADWRDGIAGDDAKFKSTLERYSTPADLGNAFREQRATISSGNYNLEPAEGADDETIAAYREANGIPAEAAGYMDNLPEGLVIGEQDAEYMGDFMGVLHGLHAPPKYAHAVIEWYNGFSEQVQDEMAAEDATQHQEAEGQLRSDWGTDFQVNMNLITSFLDNFGEKAKEQMMNGRYPDGRAFMNDPDVLKAIAQVQRTLNPITQMTPPGGDPMQTLKDEKAGLEKFMREHRDEYFKDQAKQDRLGELIQIELDHKNRSAA